jgi:hypothetical protein
MACGQSPGQSVTLPWHMNARDLRVMLLMHRSAPALPVCSWAQPIDKVALLPRK